MIAMKILDRHRLDRRLTRRTRRCVAAESRQEPSLVVSRHIHPPIVAKDL